jgi:hypothetical protein
MKLPEHTPVTGEVLAALAARHGLPTEPIVRLPDTGIFNAIYLMGDAHILRVPRQHPEHDRALPGTDCGAAGTPCRGADTRSPDL